MAHTTGSSAGGFDLQQKKIQKAVSQTAVL